MSKVTDWLELAIGPDGQQVQVPLSIEVTTYVLGRNPRAPVSDEYGGRIDIVTIGSQARAVSSTHAYLVRDTTNTLAWKYIDLQSTNGSYRNGISAHEFVLVDGDEVSLGPPNSTIGAHFTYRNNRVAPQLKRLVFNPGEQGESVLLGRDTSRTQLSLLSEQANDVHARITRKSQPSGSAYLLEDMGSRMGTYINEVPVRPGNACEIQMRDQLRFADCPYSVGSIDQQHLVLTPASKQSDEHLVAHGLTYSVRLDAGTRLGDWLRYVRSHSRYLLTQLRTGISGSGQAAPDRPPSYKTLIHGVDFVVGPNDFVLLAGASGSGNTTLMHILSTFISPQRGRLLYKGLEYTSSPEVLREHIGYVPQDDIVHEQLSLYDALSYAAELRVPAELDRTERDTFVQDVLRKLRLVKQTQQRVSKLSGGERKRANIAVELLNKPGILFLDEPTEGQDLALEQSIMALLRQLANDGTSIVLVSHRLNFLEYADYVGWLAPGGYLAYYGPPERLTDYFGLDFKKTPANRYSAVYKQLVAPPGPSAQARNFSHSMEYTNHIKARSKPRAMAPRLSTNKRAGAGKPNGLWWRQFGTLLRRGTKLLVNDGMFLLLMIVQAPLIGIVLNGLTSADMFQRSQADVFPAQRLFFLMSSSAVISGVCASMRELVKERKVFWRERMVGLRLGPYLMSKIVLLMVFCLYEFAVLVLSVLSKAMPPENGVLGFVSVPFEMLVTLFLTMFGGTTLGLLMSAVAKNQELLGLLVPLALIPQLALSKALGLPLSGIVDVFSKLTFGYWAVEALGDSGGLRYVPGPDYFGPDYNPIVSHLLQRWAALAILSAIMICLVWILQVRRGRYQSGN